MEKVAFSSRFLKAAPSDATEGTATIQTPVGKNKPPHGLTLVSPISRYGHKTSLTSA
jgi:hypothetical protein